MKATVACFAGGIGSGKSAISDRVASLLGWPRVGFGDYIRTVARQRGLDEARETLQEIGAELVAKNLEGFCQSVLKQAKRSTDQSLVVDGIRHVEVLDVVRRLVSPARPLLIFIDVDRAVCQARMLERGMSSVRLDQLESYSTEIQVADQLRDAADLEVDGTRPSETLANEIIQFIQVRS